jgi:hypothetical protein
MLREIQLDGTIYDKTVIAIERIRTMVPFLLPRIERRYIWKLLHCSGYEVGGEYQKKIRTTFA